MDYGNLAVEFSDGRKANLAIEEFHPLDRAAYQDEAGFTVFDGDTEYFVSTYGVVWQQPENLEVGICPSLKAQADRIETQITEAMEQ